MMKNFDLQFVENVASTKYSDMRGFIEIDQNDMTGLNGLCETKGIDMNKFFLYAFEIYDESPRGIAMHEGITCAAYLIDKSKYGDTYETIAENKSIVLNRKNFNATYGEIAKCIKRLSVAIASPISYEIKNVSIED